MRKVTRGIIIENGSLMVIKRVKNGETYWVFPGGGVDDGEDNVSALIRECKEELGLDVEVLDLFKEADFSSAKFGKQAEYFYFCRVIGGEFGTGDGEEYHRNDNGTYEPVLIGLEELERYDIRPREIKEMLIEKKRGRDKY